MLGPKCPWSLSHKGTFWNFSSGCDLHEKFPFLSVLQTGGVFHGLLRDFSMHRPQLTVGELVIPRRSPDVIIVSVF